MKCVLDVMKFMKHSILNEPSRKIVILFFLYKAMNNLNIGESATKFLSPISCAGSNNIAMFINMVIRIIE